MKRIIICLLAAMTMNASAVEPLENPKIKAQIVALGEKDQAAMRAGGDASKQVLEANVGELKGFILANGWPTISQVGKDGAQAAWLVAQHADFDLDFQREALAHMESLAKSGEVNSDNLAYLRDRVAHADGKPQIYGSQGQCSEGAWVPFPIGDIETVDQRREEADMEPLSDYIARATRSMCAHSE